MVAEFGKFNAAEATAAMYKASIGHKYTETITTTLKKGGEVILEKIEVYERYAPPDPAAAMAVMQIRAMLRDRLKQ